MKINELYIPATTWINLTNNVEQKKPNSKTHILPESICTKLKTVDTPLGKGGERPGRKL